MIIIGLTGSVGMGKSEASKYFLKNNIDVFDCDKEIASLYKKKEVVKEIKFFFPSTIIKNKVDTGVLANIVFNNDQKLVFADNFFLSNENDISSKTRLGYNKAIMVLVLTGLNCANTLLKIRSVIANYPCDAGSSEWNDLLVVKVLSEYPECLRDIGKKLVELFSGDPRVVPRIWIA